MLPLKIHPGRLQGTLNLPASKSQTLRAILFAAMAHGKSSIHNYLKSDDTQAMIRAMRQFGAKIMEFETTLEIEGISGHFKPIEEPLDAGNSGIVLRFCAALATLNSTYTLLTGDHSIRHNRVISPLVSALNQLGAFATSMLLNDRAPIVVRGPLQGGVAKLLGRDSQPVSALIIATSFLESPSELIVSEAGETPWIDMTLHWLRQLGSQISHAHYGHYFIKGHLRYRGFEKRIASDFSAAAVPLVAALITHSTLTIENLDFDDCQGDKKFIDLLISLGADLEIDQEKGSLTVHPTEYLKGGIIDANPIIDLVPLLAVLGCFTKDPLEISNAAIARQKESNRLLAITQELRRMGALIEEKEDGLIIEPTRLQGAQLLAHNDHRIAMALTIAALAAQTPSQLDQTRCIHKSYPNFVSDFQRLKADIYYE